MYAPTGKGYQRRSPSLVCASEVGLGSRDIKLEVGMTGLPFDSRRLQRVTPRSYVQSREGSADRAPFHRNLTRKLATRMIEVGIQAGDIRLQPLDLQPALIDLGSPRGLVARRTSARGVVRWPSPSGCSLLSARFCRLPASLCLALRPLFRFLNRFSR
jgi:hypothetical protein